MRIEYECDCVEYTDGMFFPCDHHDLFLSLRSTVTHFTILTPKHSGKSKIALQYIKTLKLMQRGVGDNNK